MQVGKYRFIPITCKKDFPDHTKPGVIIVGMHDHPGVEVAGVSNVGSHYISLIGGRIPMGVMRVLDGKPFKEYITVHVWTAPYKGFPILKAKREVMVLLKDRLLSNRAKSTAEAVHTGTVELSVSHRNRKVLQ